MEVCRWNHSDWTNLGQVICWRLISHWNWQSKDACTSSSGFKGRKKDCLEEKDCSLLPFTKYAMNIFSVCRLSWCYQCVLTLSTSTPAIDIRRKCRVAFKTPWNRWIDQILAEVAESLVIPETKTLQIYHDQESFTSLKRYLYLYTFI